MKTLCVNALLYAATCLDDRVKTSLAKLDQSPVAGIGAYGLYDPAVPAPGSFTASPTAANSWDFDACAYVFTNSSAHPFPDETYGHKRL